MKTEEDSWKNVFGHHNKAMIILSKGFQLHVVFHNDGNGFTIVSFL